MKEKSMMRLSFPLLALCLTITLLGCHPGTDHLAAAPTGDRGGPARKPVASRVLVVSIDALHPDALSPVRSPNIAALMEKGVYTLKGRSTMPPLTLVSHAAMIRGIGPDHGGRTDNDWKPGEKTVSGPTIFTDAKSRGYTTGLFYAKPKLGYLVSEDTDRHQLDQEFTVDRALSFIQKTAKGFCFVHVSGLDRVGPAEGWLSPGYMEALFYIDQCLGPLFDQVASRPGYLIVVTSDHAGHGRIHGSSHPDDAKLPLVMASDTAALPNVQDADYHVTELRALLKPFLEPMP